MLNLFYEEPDPDRWFAYDRYPRRAIRRLIRGPATISGHQRIFVNLCAGLDRLRIEYRVNDYRHIKHHRHEVACVIGKPLVLEKIGSWNPVLFGAAVYSHPIERPNLLTEYPNIQRILVPGEWMQKMCEPYWNGKVTIWPVGIDTEKWKPGSGEDGTTDQKTTDILIYDKVRWEHDRYERELIQPVRDELARRRLTYEEIRYGFYREEDFLMALLKCRAMIFLCEHETQGIAYQQALSCDVPILAWDRGGFWQDPAFYPQRVRFGPVSSVPYWDSKCGIKFSDINHFDSALDTFLGKLSQGHFSPRDYILQHLTLEQCARHYCRIVEEADPRDECPF